MKDALAISKDMANLERKYGYSTSRVMTDLVGPYYTLIFESTYDSLENYEKALNNVMGAEDWSTWYQKFIPLVDSGRREIFKIVQ